MPVGAVAETDLGIELLHECGDRRLRRIDARAAARKLRVHASRGVQDQRNAAILLRARRDSSQNEKYKSTQKKPSAVPYATSVRSIWLQTGGSNVAVIKNHSKRLVDGPDAGHARNGRAARAPAITDSLVKRP